MVVQFNLDDFQFSNAAHNYGRFWVVREFAFCVRQMYIYTQMHGGFGAKINRIEFEYEANIPIKYFVICLRSNFFSRKL